MALTKCLECGKEISDHAKTCPLCGFPCISKPVQAALSPPGKLTRREKTVILVIGAVISGLMLMIPLITNSSKPPFSYPADEINKQPDREKFIDKLISRGAITKVDDRGDFVRIYVTYRFIDTDYDTKKAIIDAVASFYAIEHNIPPEKYFAVIHNSKSGNEIGQLANGSLKMD